MSMMMRLNAATDCNSSIAAFLLLLIAFCAGTAFTSPVRLVPPSSDNLPPPPHQLQYTRPLPYHRLVEHEPKPQHASPAASVHVEAIPHATESRIHSSPDAYHSPPEAPAHYLPPAAPQQTRLHLLPPQPLPSSLYPRHPGEHGEYQPEYSHPIRPEEAENHPSQESHPLEPVYENIHVPHVDPHDSGPHGNYHPRLKYDHAPGSQQYSDDLQPHPSSHAHGYDVPAKTELYHSQDTYGNYGFGYQTKTIKGDGDYRYEKREGSETSGGYGFKTDGGKVEAHFHTHPPDSTGEFT